MGDTTRQQSEDAANLALPGFWWIAENSRVLRPGLIALILLLDAAPLVVHLASETANDTRAWVLLLLLPTVLAAGLAPRVISWIQCAIAVAVLVPTLLLLDRGLTNRILEFAFVSLTIILCAAVVSHLSTFTAIRVRRLRTLAFTDNLTGVLNRRGLDRWLQKWPRNFPYYGTVGVAMIDLDHFKQFNDDHGHTAGDQRLRLVAQTVTTLLAGHGAAARVGGEEFVIITSEPIEPLTQRLRKELADRDGTLTVSIGIIEHPYSSPIGIDTFATLIDAADQAMYRAKHDGRDQVRRGDIDDGRPHAIPPLPRARRAALPPEPPPPGRLPTRIAGFAAIFALVLALTASITLRLDSLSSPRVAATNIMLLCCLVPSIMVVVPSRMSGRRRWALAIIAIDIMLVVAVAQIHGTSSRTIVTMLLLITGMMTAYEFNRRYRIAHHVLTVAIAAVALADPDTASRPWQTVSVTVIIIAVVELVAFLRVQEALVTRALHSWSVTDPLTGLANRHGLELGFAGLAATPPLTAAVLDIDDFKDINDTYGHQTGDAALIGFADLLRETSPREAVVARIGGDEFVIIAPEQSSAAPARSSAQSRAVLTDRIRAAAQSLPIRLSASVGVAVATSEPHLWSLIDRADADLMAAKRSRRPQRNP